MRLRSGLAIGLFGLVVVLLGGIYFTLAVVILTYFSLQELFRMAEFKGIKPATKTTLLLCSILIISTYLEVNGIIEREISSSILPISSIVICTWLLLQPKSGKISDIATSIFGLFYLGFLPSFWIKLRGLDNILESSYYNGNGFSSSINISGLNITLMTCFVIVSFDIGSYFFGKKYGKRSLSIISPSKTIEGLVGGICCSFLTSIIFINFIGFNSYFLIGLLFGIIISLMSLVGDLIESMMKRDAKLKDSGNLLPGHGGILDRIDSYIFTPSLIYYFTLMLDFFHIN